MKKHLFNLGLCLLVATFGFAQSRQQTNMTSPGTNSGISLPSKYRMGSDNASRSSGTQPIPTTTVTGTCMSVNLPAPTTWTLSNYNVGPGNGYLAGTNIYGDLEQAMFYNMSTTTLTQINQVYVAFSEAYSANPNALVGIRIYDGTTNAPGAQIGTATGITMADIMADVSVGQYSLIYFTTPITIPASKKFFVSVDYTALTWPADTLNIFSNQIGQSPTSNAWERQSDGTWYNFTNAAAWGTNGQVSLYIHPFLTNAAMTASITSASSVCVGKSLSFSAAGSTAGTYNWDFGAVGTPTATGSSASAIFNTAGTYTTSMIISDACGNLRIAEKTITVNANPVVTATPASTTVCTGTSIILNGGGATSYAWTGGITNGVSFTPSSSQSYTVTGTANGCTNTAVSSVVVNATGPTVTASTTANNFCQGQSITLTGSGASTYTWTGGVTNGVAFTPSGTQTYTVIGGTGTCTNTAMITINVNALPTVTANATANTICAGGNVTLTGSGTASSYAWTGGVTNGVAFVPSSTQTYTVTGTLGTCTKTAAVTVTVGTALNVTANTTAATICQGQNVTLTGGGATSYVWTGGVTNGVAFAPSSTQTYTVTGTTGSCTNTAVTTIAVNTTPGVSSNPASATICSGANVTFSGNGASTYVWTGGISNGVAFSPSASGSYTVTGTAANGCTATAVANVTVNATPNVTANTTTTAICPGSPVTLTGGGATSYLWTDGVVNGTPFTPSVTKTYTVTGANGICTNTAVVTVVVNTSPNVTANPPAATSCNGSNITLTGGGATSYVWTGGIANGVAFSPSSSGAYTVTGTAANGCTATATSSITVVTSLNVTASASSSVVCQGSSVTLNGGGATSYVWTGGVTNGTPFTPSSTNTYTVTGTAGSCSNTAVISVTVNALPPVTANATPTNVCGGANVTLTGGGATSYAWSNGVTNGIPFAPTTSTVYVVTGTTGACSNTAAVTVVVTANPPVSAVASATSICLGSNVTLTGLGATTYTWTNGVTNNAPFTPTTTSVYVLTGSTNGCVGTTTIQVVVNTCTGIEESLTASDATVIVYPNPNTGDFTIKGNKEAILIIANELGQVIQTLELSHGNNFSYTVNGLAQGIYFLSGSAVKQKLIVTK
jgi:hypothetical protein